MNTIIAWLIVFAILCGCIFAWAYMLHRGPHAKGDGEDPSCNGDCLSCAKNFSRQVQSPEDCENSHDKQE